MTTRFMVLLLLLVGWFSPSESHAQDNCALEGPPKDAAVSENHGLFLFVFPTMIGPSYTGCQTIWDERGNAQTIRTYSKGMLVKFEMHVGSEGMVCLYDNGQPAQSNIEMCPVYSDAVRNATIYSRPTKLIVPPERDIRR